MLHTERLYYQDAYLREFSASVVAEKTLADHPAVALDRTAFYPTGGGQPNDTGVLNGIRVLDVIAEDGLVWHIIERPLPPEAGSKPAVTGAVDWDRRFDHMQQHTGQHILSEAFIKERGARTVAFHLGTGYCTIDLDRTGLGADDLAAVEAAANAVVDRALPIRAAFVTEDQMAAMPLRKKPSVEGPIRIVEVTSYDWSPCGGTHVANSAEVGLIKIAAVERRGAELRVTFLCGGRARADYARLSTLRSELVARFSTGEDELLGAIDRLMADSKVTRKDLQDLEGLWVGAQASALVADAARRGDLLVVCQAVDYPLERTKRLAQALRSHPNVVAFLGVRGEKPQLLFARAENVDLDVSKLLRSAATVVGGRGGGRPEFAQGGAPDDAAMERALAAAIAQLGELRV